MIIQWDRLPDCCHRHLGKFFSIFYSIRENIWNLLKDVNNHSPLIYHHIHINPIVKVIVVRFLFAFQTNNSHYSSFSSNVGRIGLVSPHWIVKKTKKKDRGDVFIADDEHALTHTYSFLFFFPSFFLVLSCILQPLCCIKLLLHPVGASEK